MKPEEVKNIYDTALREKYKGTYEQERWFSSPVAHAGFVMTKRAIECFIRSLSSSPKRYLEVGPGPGTWTKVFYERFGGNTAFDLVDISREMLNESKKTFSGQTNIRYFNTDFTEFTSDVMYDIFFSSRALEYFPNKDAFMERVAILLDKGGTGFVITKTPKYTRQKMLGENVPVFHGGQITPEEMRSLLVKHGFTNIHFYPVTFTFPVLRLAFLNKILGDIFERFPLNPASNFFSESYCVVFKKA